MVLFNRTAQCDHHGMKTNCYDYLDHALLSVSSSEHCTMNEQLLFYLWPKSHGLVVAPLHGTTRAKNDRLYLNLFSSAANVASIDTYTIIGITIVISFVAFFSLGVLVTTRIGCMVKKRSKVTLHHPALGPSVYEMIETHQNIIKAIELVVNSAYETAK